MDINIVFCVSKKRKALCGSAVCHSPWAYVVMLTVTFMSGKHIGFKTGKLHAILAFNHVLRVLAKWLSGGNFHCCAVANYMLYTEHRTNGRKSMRHQLHRRKTWVAFLLKVFDRCNSSFLPLSVWISLGLDVCTSVWKGTLNCRSASEEARCEG